MCIRDSTGAGQVTVWGDGTPLREFLHVDDLADACLHLMRVYDEEQTINVGAGVEMSIRELAECIAETVGFKGDIVFDTSKPNGKPRKLLDSSRLKNTGWQPKVDFKEGLAATYRCYRAKEAQGQQPYGPENEHKENFRHRPHIQPGTVPWRMPGLHLVPGLPRPGNHCGGRPLAGPDLGSAGRIQAGRGKRHGLLCVQG
eukprot:TRINITY_DN16044_c0_g2_i1.p2 TRINITY_DN16044_c0_g2~~TRINITY_DN16044_c0_g2_i1.p2  ORF type:complete len:226 (+),score=51.22 TRINITY_DN16044_c0_g2_i1:81-680(+)